MAPPAGGYPLEFLWKRGERSHLGHANLKAFDALWWAGSQAFLKRH